jgi:hypothetical protein
MTPSRRKRDDINENWQADIAAYDAECQAQEREFRKQHLIIQSEGNSELTPEENEVFDSLLRGIPCDEIAEQYGVEKEVIIGLIEVVRAKLSLSD